MTLMKPRKILKKEAREKIKNEIITLEKWGYEQKEIANIINDYPQVVSALKVNPNYPISFDKLEKKIKLIEQFKKELKEKYNKDNNI